MGTHPIFESDFDCLTECCVCQNDPSPGQWSKRRIDDPYKAEQSQSPQSRNAEFGASRLWLGRGADLQGAVHAGADKAQKRRWRCEATVEEFAPQSRLSSCPGEKYQE